MHVYYRKDPHVVSDILQELAFDLCSDETYPPMSTRVVGFMSPAPPSQAPVIPQASSATVDATTRLIKRSRWLEMNAEASRGTPATSEEGFNMWLRPS